MRDNLGGKGLLSDDKRSVVVVGENSRSYRASNSSKKRVLCYRIDGGMLDGNGQRCDYAVGMPDDKKLYLVELKGCDLRHAASQILATLEELKPKIKSYTIRARVVLSRVPRPDIRASNVIALERKLLSYGGDLQMACVVIEEVV